MPSAPQRVRFPRGDCVTKRLAPVPPAAGSHASLLSDPSEIAPRKHSAPSRNSPHPTSQDSGAQEGFWTHLQHRPLLAARWSVTMGQPPRCLHQVSHHAPGLATLLLRCFEPQDFILPCNPQGRVLRRCLWSRRTASPFHSPAEE